MTAQYSDMKVAQLRALCANKFIDTTGMLEKKEYVKALETADSRSKAKKERDAKAEKNRGRSKTPTKKSKDKSSGGTPTYDWAKASAPKKDKPDTNSKKTDTGSNNASAAALGPLGWFIKEEEGTTSKTKSDANRSAAKAQAQRQRGRSPGPTPAKKSNNKPRQAKSLPPPKNTAAQKPKPAARPPTSFDYDTHQDLIVPANEDDDAFYEAVVRCIPSDFVIIASQDSESQAQEDYNAMEHFGIKPPEGKVKWSHRDRPGSVATVALMQMAQENPNCWVAGKNVKPYSTLEILQEIRERIKAATNLEAHPTITASRPLGPPRFADGTYMPYYVVPPGYKGKRRALHIAVVSGGASGKPLLASINDAYLVNEFLIRDCGFKPENITMLTETALAPASRQPTKKNITDAFKKMVQESKPGDVNFIQFSGHGNRSDTNLYIMPSDVKKSGYIQDERILKNLIKAMPKGVYTTFLVDCCYSGTIGDLPYILKADSVDQGIDAEFNLDIRKSQLAMHPNLATNHPLKNINTPVAPSSSTTTNKPQGKNNKREQPRQSIRTYYDTDTLEETMAKEKSGGEEYQKIKQARRRKTAKQFGFGDFDWKSFQYTVHAAKDAGEQFDSVLDQSMHAATKSAKAAGISLKRAVRSLSPMRVTSSSTPDKDKHKAKANKKDTINPASDSTFKTDGSSNTFDEDIPAPKTKPAKKATKSKANVVPTTNKKDSAAKTSKKRPKSKSPVRTTKPTKDEAGKKSKSKTPVRKAKSASQ